ncbi:MAG: Uma2 family endonuclease [Gemmataceae bacterium]
MSSILAPLNLNTPLPDHNQLPSNDGVPVRNSLEPWQSSLLSETLEPVLRTRYPEGDYFIGQDCGIYWEKTDPPAQGCKAPDWYLIPNVPRLLDGQMRRSYVLWQELELPLVLLEYASDRGAEERDNTPMRGKFWVYDRKIHPAFYGIYLPDEARIEMYHAVEHHLELMPSNQAGRFPIRDLGVELGIWHGSYAGYEIPWMRWWDESGRLLPTREESEIREKLENERLAAKLRALGVDPNV